MESKWVKRAGAAVLVAVAGWAVVSGARALRRAVADDPFDVDLPDADAPN